VYRCVGGFGGSLPPIIRHFEKYITRWYALKFTTRRKHTVADCVEGGQVVVGGCPGSKVKKTNWAAIWDDIGGWYKDHKMLTNNGLVRDGDVSILWSVHGV